MGIRISRYQKNNITGKKKKKKKKKKNKIFFFFFFFFFGGFFFFFFFFFLFFVDWDKIFGNFYTEEKPELVINWDFSRIPAGLWVFFSLFFVFFLWQLILFITSLRDVLRMRYFFQVKLNISNVS